MPPTATAADNNPRPPSPAAVALPALPGLAAPGLLVPLLRLALPVMAEQVLHMLVGLTDTYLANHLPGGVAADATAAVGTISYVLWLIGLMVMAVGTGATALIARAHGARHRSLANRVTGQSFSAALLGGLVIGALMYALAGPLVRLTGLAPQAQAFALSYLRMLSLTMPFTTVTFIANSCQRGAGDTITPAAVMILVDGVNIAFTFGLCRGYWGLPMMGFDGIAAGTVIAYLAGGVIQAVVLFGGWGLDWRLKNGLLRRGAVRLHAHRLRPHWRTLQRVLRIGVPAGSEGMLTWAAQFTIVTFINRIDPTSAMAAAHINAVRIESVSFLGGLAFATAAATLVGQSLGMRDPARAERSAYLAYAAGGGLMALIGLLFIAFGALPARWLSSDPHIAGLTARCLQITGFAQAGFAASMIFSGALRGAGDTVRVMVINLASVFGIRFIGVLIVALLFGGGLAAIWTVLAAELLLRGVFIYARFARGQWKTVRV